MERLWTRRKYMGTFEESQRIRRSFSRIQGIKEEPVRKDVKLNPLGSRTSIGRMLVLDPSLWSVVGAF